jgi:hypothetical protein
VHIPSGDVLEYRALHTVYKRLCPPDELRLGIRCLDEGMDYRVPGGFDLLRCPRGMQI